RVAQFGLAGSIWCESRVTQVGSVLGWVSSGRIGSVGSIWIRVRNLSAVSSGIPEIALEPGFAVPGFAVRNSGPSRVGPDVVHGGSGPDPDYPNIRCGWGQLR